ncbi:hypothetical protein B0H63DRAFT_514924 [Podospora didyma]|uniref:Uncharacterized protein n=1 Tax=Podospora didyma TaxID=330526 RepID=A0AAE0N304_9PEZI|nr:hypothetical protein B0H63DRAFT_514924 [Podospora didyma]
MGSSGIFIGGLLNSSGLRYDPHGNDGLPADDLGCESSFTITDSQSSIEDILSRRKALPSHRHEDVVRGLAYELAELVYGLGPVGPVQLLGKVTRPLVNKYYGSTSNPLLEFQGADERILLRPLPAATAGPEPTLRYLERLEAEMFDVSKYHMGSSAQTNYFTVLTWAAESNSGTITLFEVETSIGNDAASRPSSSPQRKRRASAPSPPWKTCPKQCWSRCASTATSAAATTTRSSSSTPRTDSGGVQRRPGSGCPLMRKRSSFSLRSSIDGSPLRRPPPPPTPLPTTEVGQIRHHRERAEEEADADGVLATIPQFLALLHANNRSILDCAPSNGVTHDDDDDDDDDNGRTRVRTAEGGGKLAAARTVTVLARPMGKSYPGRDVHVVVLLPPQQASRTAWADERIFWADDERRVLKDLKQRKFWDLIERGELRA